MTTTHRVLHFVPDQGVTLRTVANTLAAHQELVAGLIETVTLRVDPRRQGELTLVVNEEGLMLELPVGWAWPGTLRPIFGSFFVARSQDDPAGGRGFVDLLDADIPHICHLFGIEPDELLADEEAWTMISTPSA